MRMLSLVCLSLLTAASAGGSEGWGGWSPWSSCSRTCDSGLQRRERVCLNSTGCRGEALAHQVCSVHPCPPSAPAWRDEQCARFNNQPWEGAYRLWQGTEGEEFPCRLDCQAVDDEDLVVTMKEQVEDGTRCGTGGLSVCLQGACKEVGCDLIVGSGMQLDSCGVCGGNGTTCSVNRFSWEQVPLSRCSVSCGTGTKMVRSVCRDGETGLVVEEEMCDVTTKPDIHLETCNANPCPARWEVSPWSSCERECTGVRKRRVHCVADQNSQKIKVDPASCPGERPASEQPCSSPHCPIWYTGQWSGCSVDCGLGTQERSVECQNSSGLESEGCSGTKPSRIQQCRGSCSDGQSNHSNKHLGSEMVEVDEGSGTSGEEFNYVEPPMEVNTEDRLAAIKQVLLKNQPSFLVGQWSKCSATCGEGIRWRKVECKILLEFSGTIATLPDKECPGLKPAETEMCLDVASCSPGMGSEEVVGRILPLENPNTLPLVQQEQPYTGPAYIWKISGYTDCTASCLGGLQESIVVCVEAEKETPVAPYFCDAATRLDIEVRACNEKPCPPRWNVSDFSACSQTCGGGNQNRTVECIQEVAHGKKNVIKLPESECTQPPPRSQQFCNVLDCPVNWNAGSWTKCSKRCGPGRKYRKVRCRQLLSLGQTIEKPERECAGPKPHNEEPCDGTECHKIRANPKIRSNKNQNYDQPSPPKQTVKLKIGGTAAVFRGTNLKIRCPVKHFEKSAIVWSHRGRPLKIRHSGTSVSRKGVLRIKDIQQDDDGLYTCTAGKSSADILITVKEVLTRHENGLNNNIPDARSEADEASPTGTSNQTDVTTESFDDRWKWNSYKDDEEYLYWDTISNQIPGDNQFNSNSKLLTHRRDRTRSKKRKNGSGNSPLSWVPGRWGPCSRTCRGHRRRSATCHMMMTERKGSQPVPNSFCVAAAVPRPKLMRRCGGECPRWIHSPWSPCSMAECLSKYTGMMTRSVDCIKDGRILSPTLCDSRKKPAESQPCHNQECLGVWVLGEWSQCSRTCGKSERRRSVSCEWLRGGHAPTHECEEGRPSSLMECEAPACRGWDPLPIIQVSSRDRDGRDTGSPCQDTSKFCPVVKSYNLCDTPKYKDQCCKTCTR